MLNTEKEQSRKAKPASTIKKVAQKQIEEESVTFRAETTAVRYLKLRPFCRQSRSNFIANPQSVIVPELRLCGNWLENAGFATNGYVSVTVMDGLLIIRLTTEVDEINKTCTNPIK